jgi:release factor glutamine methyltransferase
VSAASYTLEKLLPTQRLAFAKAGVESPELSAQVLLAESLGLTREQLLHQLIINPKKQIPPDAFAVFADLCVRRLQGEPVAYILGHKEFYGRTFRVNSATLIPRPETELLIDEALKFAENTPKGIFADFGTGSGCLAITLSMELPGWKGLGVDISAEACRVAQYNAQNLGIAPQISPQILPKISPAASTRLTIMQADFTKDLLRTEALDLLVSNPPYISAEEYTALDAGIRLYEPESALVPLAAPAVKASGLEHLEIIFRQALRILRPGGLLLMEHGSTQGQKLYDLCKQNINCIQYYEIIKDLSELERVCLVRKRA